METLWVDQDKTWSLQIANSYFLEGKIDEEIHTKYKVAFDLMEVWSRSRRYHWRGHNIKHGALMCQLAWLEIKFPSWREVQRGTRRGGPSQHEDGNCIKRPLKITSETMHTFLWGWKGSCPRNWAKGWKTRTPWKSAQRLFLEFRRPFVCVSFILQPSPFTRMELAPKEDPKRVKLLVLSFLSQDTYKTFLISLYWKKVFSSSENSFTSIGDALKLSEC